MISSTPLGQEPQASGDASGIPLAVPQVIAGLLGLFIATFAGWALVVNDPLGGEPMVVAPSVREGQKLPVVVRRRRRRRQANPTARQSSRRHRAGADNTITIIDGSTGKRQEVPIAAPQDSRAPAEQRLLEASRHGAIPKIAPDGKRPSEAYARAAPAQTASRTRRASPSSSPGLGVSGNCHPIGDEQAAGPGDVRVRAVRHRDRAHGFEGAQRGPRGAAANPDGAVRLSGQRSGSANAAGLARRPSKISTGCTG